MDNSINVHCHLLNLDFVPDSFFKSRAPVREWMLRNKVTGWLARAITLVLPGIKYDKVHEVLDILNQDIRHVAETLIAEMDKANIALATPLMMDLEFASFNVKPEIPYRYQAQLMSTITLEHKGRLLPFIMLDPRRKDAFELVKTALEDKGFLGIKMYPPLGYHPEPSSFINNSEVNETLEMVYKYCQEHSIPITTHCSKGGAYSADLIHSKNLAFNLCNPSNWEEVLEKYPDLILNFAHFGGNGDFLDFFESTEKESWTNKIQLLMKQFKNVYADVSYHDGALTPKTRKKYFDILNELMDDEIINQRILFGSDWLMTRHTWTENMYVEIFKDPDNTTKYDMLGLNNPLKFLFFDGKLPARIVRFFKDGGVGAEDLPQWMRDNKLIEGLH